MNENNDDGPKRYFFLDLDYENVDEVKQKLKLTTLYLGFPSGCALVFGLFLFFPLTILSFLMLTTMTNPSRAIGGDVTFTTCNGLFLLGLGLYGSGYMIVNLIRNYLAAKRCQRLIQSGILLDGKLIGVQSKVIGRQNAYFVHVVFEFEAPDGALLRGRQSNQREDLRNRKLPTAGTSVKVLYADKDAFVIL